MKRDWMDEFKKKEALWIHDGNMKRPHALLTSGRHSDGFFNSRLVISDESLLREAVSDLINLYRHANGFAKGADIIVGPQTGATKIAEFMSDEGQKYGWMCGWASPEKVGEGKNKRMFFSLEEFSVLEDKAVLLCEDVITTGGSIDLTATAVIEAGGIILPHVLSLVNRSGLKKIDGRKIVSLVDKHMPTWEPSECPLCKEGSKALRSKDNWKSLNE